MPRELAGPATTALTGVRGTAPLSPLRGTAQLVRGDVDGYAGKAQPIAQVQPAGPSDKVKDLQKETESFIKRMKEELANTRRDMDVDDYERRRRLLEQIERDQQLRKMLERRLDWMLSMERGRLARLESLVLMGILDSIGNFGASGVSGANPAAKALAAEAGQIKNRKRDPEATSPRVGPFQLSLPAFLRAAGA